MSQPKCPACGASQENVPSDGSVIRCPACGIRSYASLWFDCDDVEVEAAPEEPSEDEEIEESEDDTDYDAVLESMTYAELKLLAKEKQIPNYYRTSKADLIEILRGGDE